MYIKYDKLPKNSRVWVYQASNFFSSDDLEYISDKTIEFIDQWTRHGDDLKASFTIKYSLFLILAVDESYNDVSGCSIDSSVRFIKGLEKELGVDLMNKTNVTYKQDNNIKILKLLDFKELIKKGKITSETIVFNNMINTKEAFEKQWEVMVKNSWHSRFLM